MKSLLFRTFILANRVVRGLANRTLDPKEIHPRPFSNAALRKYASLFSGDVVNVSGWKDEDEEGSRYKDYFTKAASYTVTNVGGQKKGLGSAGGYREIELDLTAELPVSLHGAFDVVFNHTTLEHIYDFKKAFSNLCAMSRDAVVLVVPVMQQIHHSDDFGDYWRPTTMGIGKLFHDSGFHLRVLKCNDQPFAPIYCFAIAVREPGKYAQTIPREIDYEMGSFNYGSSLQAQHIPGLIER